VTGGTRVLSDRIVVRITAAAGKSFLDRMIALVEGAIRHRTPNEIALSLVLSAFTLIFLIVCVALWPIARHTEQYMASFVGAKDMQSLGTDIPTSKRRTRCAAPAEVRSADREVQRSQGPRPTVTITPVIGRCAPGGGSVHQHGAVGRDPSAGADGGDQQAGGVPGV
jgi:hypothetical protein